MNEQINAAMNAVMKECHNLKHDDGKEHGKKLDYNYISNEKVMDFFRPLLAEKGLSFSFGLIGGRTWNEDITRTKWDNYKKETVEYTSRIFYFEGAAIATFRHVSGEQIDVPFFVAGQNNGGIDKAMGSALTYGERYFLLKQFLVASSDEEDPDSRENEPENTAQPPKQPQKPAQQSTPPGVGKAEIELEKSRAKIYASIDKHGLFRETEGWCRERGVQAWTDGGDELNHELTQENLAELYIYLKKIVEDRK